MTKGNIYVAYLVVITIAEYRGLDGRSPYFKWFNRFSAPAAAKVATAIVRMEQGKFPNYKVTGAGVFECRIFFGPGYRIYFGKDGDAVILIFLGNLNLSLPSNRRKNR